MSDATLGWVVVLALGGVPIVVAIVGSHLSRRGIWAAGKDNDGHRGSGGGAVAAEAVVAAAVVVAAIDAADELSPPGVRARQQSGQSFVVVVFQLGTSLAATVGRCRIGRRGWRPGGRRGTSRRWSCRVSFRGG
jgi:hypothetical protein